MIWTPRASNQPPSGRLRPVEHDEHHAGHERRDRERQVDQAVEQRRGRGIDSAPGRKPSAIPMTALMAVMTAASDQRQPQRLERRRRA